MNAATGRYVLKTPIVINGKAVAEVTMRQAVVGDLVAAEAAKGEVAMSVAIIGRLVALPAAVMAEMSIEDFNTLAAMFSRQAGGKGVGLRRP